MQPLPGGIVPALRCGKLGAAAFGIGQCGAAGFGGGKLGFGGLALFGKVTRGLGQFGAAGLKPGFGRLGLVNGAQGRTLRLSRFGHGAFRGDHRQLQFGQFRLHSIGTRRGLLGRLALAWQFGFERSQTVLGLKPSRFGCAFALGDEAVPAADPPGAGDQPFARAQRAAIILFGNMDQGEAGLELLRALADVGGKAARNRLWCRSAGPEPAILARRSLPQRCLGVAAQHGGQCALVPRRGAHLIKRHWQAVFAAGLLGPRIAIAYQRLPLALNPGQFGLGRCQCR